MATTKEKYDALKKKYSLPAYEDINRDFSVEDIDSESTLILQKIRVNMHEKLDYYAKMIEFVLQPDSSLSGMYEAHYVSEEDKASAYSLFKRLMHLLRYSNAVSVTNNEEDNGKFIKEGYSDWNSMKPEILKHIKRLLSVWDKETDIKEDLNYFG